MGTERGQSALDWLLEPNDAGVRYLAMRDLTEASQKELLPVKKKAHAEGPIARVLDLMNPAGYWEQPGTDTTPNTTERYGRSSCWPSSAPTWRWTSVLRLPAVTFWTIPSHRKGTLQ